MKRTLAAGLLAVALGCSHESAGPNQSSITATSLAPHLDSLKFISEAVRLAATSRTSSDTTAGIYRWRVSDTTVLSGTLVAPDTFVAFARAEGSAVVRVFELGGTRDSAVIVVRQQTAQVRVTPLLAYRACPVGLTAVAVDSGGTPVAHHVSVTLVSRAPARATIDSTFLLSPRAAGLDTIVATAEGVSTPNVFRIDAAPVFQVGNTPFSTIVIGATQLAVLTPRAMTTTGAPLTLHFQSSDSAVARLPVAAVAVPLGYQVPPGTDVDGLVPGTALVRVTACDVLSDSVTLRVTTPKFLLSAIPSGARTDDRPSRVEVDIGDSLGAFGSTFAPLTVHVSATDTAVIHPDSAYIHVPARTYATASVLTWASHGTARVVFADSAGRYPPDTSGPVSVSFPPLYLSVVRDTIALGMRQRRSIDLGVDRTVTGAPLVVHVAVNDTTALIESPATLTMPVGSTGGPPLVFTGRDTSGVATIIATAYRHEPTAVTVRVTRPQFGVGAPVSGIPHYPGEPPGDVVVGAGDSLDALSYSGAGAPIENVTADIVSSNPSIASLDSTTLTIPAGQGPSGTAHLSFNAPGNVTITATDPRSAYYHYGTATSATVVIVPKRLVFSDSVMLLGIGQFWSDAVFLEGRIPTDLVVSLSHTASAVATLDHPIDTLFSTGPSGPVALHGLAAGVDTVVATASGWLPDTLPVRVGPGTVVLWGWPSALRQGDSAQVSLQVDDQAGEGRLADVATTFTLAPNGNIVFTSASGVIGTITVAAKNQGTGYFYVKAVAPGTGTVNITNASYQPYSNSVSVMP